MKAFEEMMNRDYPHVRLTSREEKWARRLWKTALEWAKTQHSVNDTKPYRTIDVDIIDEELKSE